MDRDCVSPHDRTQAHSSLGLSPWVFFVSCGSAAGAPRGSAAGVARGSEASVVRWFLGAAYCAVGCRGGVFAQLGTISSSLLLPEQLASSALKIPTTRMRSMTAVSPRMPL